MPKSDFAARFPRGAHAPQGGAQKRKSAARTEAATNGSFSADPGHHRPSRKWRRAGRFADVAGNAIISREREGIMPYASNGDIRIHYQIEGSGQALVLQHGFTDSLTSWYDAGYVDPLKHDYMLILIDARGHGDSDKPHNTAAYAMELRVADIVCVMNEL